MADATTAPVGGATNEIVSTNATKTGELPLDRVSLIGIMGKPAEKKALFRMTRGDILTVTRGEKTNFGTISEITDAGVVILRNTGNSVFVPPVPLG
ncbi:pilus assembly protein PilP [Maritimibacter sp. DP1N21-5]|uniref:pilus assembly protein PilP n=1 Tax=Maritimibacter sp. DP1N21-5 TaxID=2836867 RepID=UPI001C4945F3|nr:pilus assembly protein PilP [Maritimibacter sp. DP1N21-5]MBV7410021.1 pilus assembly protein PilP [Maritimibacter sp. DP1N21-5]